MLDVTAESLHVCSDSILEMAQLLFHERWRPIYELTYMSTCRTQNGASSTK